MQVLVESLTEKRTPKSEFRIVIVRTDARITFISWVQDQVHIQVLTRFFTAFV
jgi:hypothetical protein